MRDRITIAHFKAVYFKGRKVEREKRKQRKRLIGIGGDQKQKELITMTLNSLLLFSFF